MKPQYRPLWLICTHASAKCAAYLYQHAWVCVPFHPKTTSKPLQHQGKAFLPVSSRNVPWSQKPLMAKVATLIFSRCLKVRFYRYFVSPGPLAFLLLALAYYLLFLWQVSELDRVATQEAWVAEVGCQQAYDCGDEMELKQGKCLPACECSKWKSWWRHEACAHTRILNTLVFYECQSSHTILAGMTHPCTQVWSLIGTNVRFHISCHHK